MCSIQKFYMCQLQYLLSFLMIGQKNVIKPNNSTQALVTTKTVDGKYQIKNKLLGKGSFAETFLAVDIITGEELACKMISKRNLIDKINSSKNKSLTKQYFITALKNEVKTWKGIEHQNIVQFKDFSETANNIYFFLEFCSQGNLEKMIEKRGYIKQAQAISIMFQIAKGCEHLYNKGIFHRDIKTENILISCKNVVKISDFGFAKMIAEQDLKNNPTVGTSVGTPIYMSPQILLGEPYTIKCDVWSCGVVFYKILYNLFPWEKTQNLQVLIQRIKKQLMFPPHIKVSEWIKELIRGMLTESQQKRLGIIEVVKYIQKNSESLIDTQ